MPETLSNPELEALRAENAELKAALAQVTQQLEWFKRQLFGRKSERHLPPDPSQGNLLADLAPEPPAGAVPTETVTYIPGAPPRTAVTRSTTAACASMPPSRCR